MRIDGIEQNTPDWHIARCGVVTASRAADVVAKLKRSTNEAAARYNYRMEILAERLTMRLKDNFTGGAAQWGLDTQPQAAAAVEQATGYYLEPGGFWMHDTIANFGASPDYLVGDYGLIEVKCQNSDTHLEQLVTGVVPEEYLWQMRAQLAVTRRKWCEYVSFDPRMPEELQLFRTTIGDTDPLISAIELEVIQFNKEVEMMLETLRTNLASTRLGSVVSISEGR